VLDLAQKITITSETPNSKYFLAYKLDNDTTVYQTIDVADDIDINSLSSLATPDNASDQLLIYDADGLTNKKITPGNPIPPKAVMGTAPVVDIQRPDGPAGLEKCVLLLVDPTFLHLTLLCLFAHLVSHAFRAVKTVNRSEETRAEIATFLTPPPRRSVRESVASGSAGVDMCCIVGCGYPGSSVV
jgi:hypothetical protein